MDLDLDLGLGFEDDFLTSGAFVWAVLFSSAEEAMIMVSGGRVRGRMGQAAKGMWNDGEGDSKL